MASELGRRARDSRLSTNWSLTAPVSLAVSTEEPLAVPLLTADII